MPGDEKMAETMKDFCEYFAEKLELRNRRVISLKKSCSFCSFSLSILNLAFLYLDLKEFEKE
jgi:hypothetical protein